MGTRAPPSGGDLQSDSDSTNDELYEVLANRRRRYTIHALKREGGLDVGQLADQVTAWEEETPVDRVSKDGRKSVYTSLRQNHLPKLDEAGIVDFDKHRGTIEPTSEIDDVEIYMELVEGKQIPWHQLQMGVAAVSLLVLTAAWIGAWPFALFPDITWAAAIVALVCATALTQYYHKSRMRLGNGNAPPEIE